MASTRLAPFRPARTVGDRSGRRRSFARRDGYWLWVGGPVPPGAAAVTLGRLVSVRRRSAGNDRLLRHEEEHVRQFRERGWLGFLARYLWDYLSLRWRGWAHWSAYRRLPFEVEAEWRSRRPDLDGRLTR